MKTIAANIPTNLVKILFLFCFCPFVESKSKDQISSKLVVGNDKYFCSLIIASCAVFPFYKEFSYMLQLFLLQFHAQTITFSDFLFHLSAGSRNLVNINYIIVNLF